MKEKRGVDGEADPYPEMRRAKNPRKREKGYGLVDDTDFGGVEEVTSMLYRGEGEKSLETY